MTLLLRVVEIAFLVLFGAWTLGSVLYALAPAGLRGRLERWNIGLWWADWTVFGAGGERAEIATHTIEYRDRDRDAVGPWVEIMQGRPWRWHAFAWQPERRVADRLHRLAEGIARARDLEAVGAQRSLAERRRMIANYLEAACPRPVGRARDIRVTMRRCIVETGATAREAERSEWVEQRVLLSFTVEGDS